MNKAELTGAIAVKLNTTQKFAGTLLDAVLDEIMHQVANGNKVSITGFGAFEATHRPARTAQNPRTGEPVQVPASTSPKFKAGATFKDTVNT